MIKTRYISKKPCLKGHVGERLISNRSCVQCEREREKLKNKRRNKIAAAKVQFQEYKSALFCSQCGFSHPAALQFHHLNGNNKLLTVSRMLHMKGLKRALKETQKCIVLCANCHAILHYNERKGVRAPKKSTRAKEKCNVA